jgi:acyl dehydratase
MPSIVTVLGAPGAWAREPDTGIDWLRIVHGEHRVQWFAPLLPADTLESHTAISHVIDKGEGRGALVVTRRLITSKASGQRVAQIDHTSFCRNDGGFSQPSISPDPGCPLGGDAVPEPLPAQPSTAPKAQLSLQIDPRAALLYRLNGDENPIHADPSMAAQAGFSRPILHGLCTYGMAVRALLELFCDDQPERLRSCATRFSAPVLPGEALLVQCWKQQESDGQITIAFCARAGVDQRLVLSHGVASITT